MATAKKATKKAATAEGLAKQAVARNAPVDYTPHLPFLGDLRYDFPAFEELMKRAADAARATSTSTPPMATAKAEARPKQGTVLEPQRPHRVEVALAKLRPTQLTAGFAEVAQKRAAWEKLGKKARRSLLDSHFFPAVHGPEDLYYIVDHHHLGIALIQEGVKKTDLLVLDDLSYLAPPVFWRVMEVHDWVHPFDHEGNRQPYTRIPKKLVELVDDPHRSLAGFLRTAGGFAKDASPFAEFLWANYLRPHVTASDISASIDDAVRVALVLAKSPLARYLPGWAGAV